MTYPRLKINLSKIRNNTRELVSFCHTKGISVTGISKVFLGEEKIARIYYEEGVDYLGDSRIENLKKMSAIDLPKILIRLPMLSEVDQVVRYADISLNSSLETIEALDVAGEKISKSHGVILMLDLGDLREGYFQEADLIKDLEKVLSLKNIDFKGIATNLTCYGGVIPSKAHMKRLSDLEKRIKSNLGVQVEILSGGNSSSLSLVKDKGALGINNLRLGESIALGRETAYSKKIDNCYQDAFILEAELIEIKEKPSRPIGEIGRDAFGNKPVFPDYPNHRRGICAIGRQDIDPLGLFPLNQDLSILGASSDHLILDLGLSSNYNLGDKLSFNMNYSSLLRAMTSPYVEKIYIE